MFYKRLTVVLANIQIVSHQNYLFPEQGSVQALNPGEKHDHQV